MGNFDFDGFRFIFTENDPPQFDVENTAAGAAESSIAGGSEAAASLFRVDYAP